MLHFKGSIMKKTIISLIFILIFSSVAYADFYDNFKTDKNWVKNQGEWQLSNGVYSQKSTTVEAISTNIASIGINEQLAADVRIDDGPITAKWGIIGRAAITNAKGYYCILESAGGNLALYKDGVDSAANKLASKPAVWDPPHHDFVTMSLKFESNKVKCGYEYNGKYSEISVNDPTPEERGSIGLFAKDAAVTFDEVVLTNSVQGFIIENKQNNTVQEKTVEPTKEQTTTQKNTTKETINVQSPQQNQTNVLEDLQKSMALQSNKTISAYRKLTEKKGSAAQTDDEIFHAILIMSGMFAILMTFIILLSIHLLRQMKRKKQRKLSRASQPINPPEKYF